jgi:PEGA domain-containing protein
MTARAPKEAENREKSSILLGIPVAVESVAASCLLKGALVRSKTYLPILVLVGVAGLSTLWPAKAEAQFRRGHVRGAVVIRSGFFYDPFFYDPFFNPWFGYQYPYPPYPYPPYGYGVRFDNSASIRVLVTPKEADVYVDGYHAGVVDDFDGIFQRLHVPPGDHEITLYHEGYRTARQKLYLAPRSESKLRYTMTPLAAGEPNEPRPVAPAVAPPGPEGPQQGMYPPRRMPPQRIPPPERVPPQGPPPSQPGENSRYGSLSIRVQPAGAEVLIDGERWRGPESDEHLVVQVSEGPHRVEVQKDGFQRFSSDVQVRRGETTPVNVSLTRQ